MGFIFDFLRGQKFTSDAEDFAGADIDPAVFGLKSFGLTADYSPRVDRRSAMSVPAVKRSRDLIAGTLGGLPLDLYGPDKQPSVSSLFEQPERDVPRSVTMTRTFEDLLFEQVAWWKVTDRGWHGYPVFVKRLDPNTVSTDNGVVYVNGKAVDDTEIIRFDSPTDSLLIAGARAIRTCLALDDAARRNSDGAPPIDYFTPADGNDPADDDDIVEMLDNWKTSRQQRSTGYVPAALKYNVGGWSPEQLQMAEARQHAVLEIARLAGVDPEELGVSTTSRTYANQFDRRKQFVDFTLGQYRQAFEDRLSMGDVTPRGYYAKMNLDSFLRSDTKTRYETYEIGKRVGAVTDDEIREMEDKPVLTPAQKKAITPAPAPAEQPAIDNVRPLRALTASATDFDFTFDEEPTIRLDAPMDNAAFEVDVEKRTIRGLAVPYGVVGISNGQKWQFSQGSIKFADVSRVKLWVQHDKTQAVGVAFEIDDRPDGLYPAFKVARGPEGDRALSLAEDGVLDGLSIGLKQGGKFQNRGGINFAVEAPLMEISLTPAPSFDDARVHAVAASADMEGNEMKCTKCGQTHNEGVIACDATALATFEAGQSGLDFSSITDAIGAGFAGLMSPQGDSGPALIKAGGDLEVKEEPLYRFDGVEGKNCFVDDLRAANFGDSEARQRIAEFTEETFAVTSSGVGSLNPTKNRPDLYVGNLAYSRPLWEMTSNGGLTDKTPFTVPKFSAASGLVGAHTEGTEPTPGSFSATSQTITPSAISGKIEINREVLDQGGSPQADQIIWAEMLNAWYEAIEAKIAATLAAVGTAEVNLAGAVDEALVDGVTNIFTGLQFARGGNRFTGLALDGQLFPALVNASDTTGRKLLPVVGPQNAQGSVGGGFDRVAIGNQIGRAAWALGSATTSKSYLFVPSSVWAWASAPQKFQFEYQVKSVDLAIWGYSACAVLRDTDVRPIDYTTAD